MDHFLRECLHNMYVCIIHLAVWCQEDALNDVEISVMELVTANIGPVLIKPTIQDHVLPAIQDV